MSIPGKEGLEQITFGGFATVSLDAEVTLLWGKGQVIISGKVKKKYVNGIFAQPLEVMSNHNE